jgi:hypothetical protein
MPIFAPPLSFRLNGGLKRELPLAPLEDVFGVHLEVKDDFERGGAYHRYAPHPIPVSGLVDVLVHSNEIPNGWTYVTRRDLEVVVIADWFNTNALDLGRLEWRLRAAYGDLFDVVAYSVVTLTPPGEPFRQPRSHWVEFAASPGHRTVPLANTPLLACTLDVEVPGHREDAARMAIAELTDSVAVPHRVDAAPAGGARSRLTLRFDSPSLLELGRYAEAIALTAGDETRFIGYSVHGDMLRDGQHLHVEHAFPSNESAYPAWRVAERPR